MERGSEGGEWGRRGGSRVQGGVEGYLSTDATG